MHHSIFVTVPWAIAVMVGICQAVEPIAAPPAFDMVKLLDAATHHPRLFLTERRLTDLRVKISTTHASMWKAVRAQADALVKSGPPPYQPAGDWEQLWQRPVGNALPILSITYLLTQDRTYLDAGKRWAAASCAYPTWGLDDCNGLDLATGHQLLGLAIFYDWCHADLDETTRQLILRTLRQRANGMYHGVLAGRTFWGRTYLQNHLWVNSVGLTAAALSVIDEPDARREAADWLGFTADAMRRTFDSLGDDGASHEGVAYWEYGVEYLLKYAAISRDLLGVDYFKNPWLSRTALFPIYLSLPRHAWTKDNCITDFADSPRSHWYGPDYLLYKLADEYHDGRAQWYGREAADAGVCRDVSSWLNLLWYNPQVAPTPPAALPTLHHFDDLGIVSARSDWGGDESLVVFKCGPFIGRKAINAFAYDPGGSHVHPDANHFVLFGGGQWLLRDDGYRPKMTASHNTLMIDGLGQLGEGKHWFDAAAPLAAKSEPWVTETTTAPTIDRMTGDATAAYPAAAGLKRYQRHLLFIKPDTVIVIDDIAADHVADLDLRFHPECAEVSQQDHVMLMTQGDVHLRAELLTPDGITYSSETVSTPGRSTTQPTDLLTLHLRSRKATSLTAIAFTWAKAKPARQVTLKRTQETWIFHVGDDEFSFKSAEPNLSQTSPTPRAKGRSSEAINLFGK